MRLHFLALLLAISTQSLLSSAAGGRGKGPLESAPVSDHDHHLASELQREELPHSSQNSEEDNHPSHWGRTQTDIHAFANRYLMDNGLIRKKQSKEEWIEFQARNNDVAEHVLKLYRDRKAKIKALSVLRIRYKKNPLDFEILSRKVQELGFDVTELTKGQNKISKEEKSRIRKFCQRFRAEIAETYANPGAWHNDWNKVNDEPEESTGFLKELNHFRDTFRQDPFNPNLRPWMNQLNERLNGIYSRSFIKLFLPGSPAHYETEGYTGRQVHYPLQGNSKKSRNQMSKGDTSSSSEQLHESRQHTIHHQQQPSNVWDSNYYDSQRYHRFISQHVPESSHAQPHMSSDSYVARMDLAHPHQQSNPDLYNYYPHMEQSDYGNQMGQDYSNLDSQMDHMQLDSRIMSKEEILKLSSPERRNFLKNMFYSDGESEDE